VTRRLPPALVIASLAVVWCRVGDADAAAPVWPPAAGGAEAYVSHDTEGFSTYRATLDLLPEFRNGDALTALRYTYTAYAQHDWRREGQQLAFLKRAIDPATANGWQLNAGVSEQGDHTMLALDGGYRRALTSKTALELFVDRQWVETQPALDRGVHGTFVGASMDQGLSDHWTLVGLVGEQEFSDGNHREHFRGKVIYQPSLDSGLTLQLRYRAFRSTDGAVVRSYFDPRRYDETMLAVGWRKRLRGWTLRLAAGTGEQHVDAASGTRTRLLEFGLESPYRGNRFVRLRGGHTQSASDFGPTYAYTYLQGEWIARF